MSTLEVWIIIAAVSLGAFASRVAFLVRPNSTRLPPWAWEILNLLPAAAFAALVAPAILLPGGELDLLSARTASALVAIAVAWWTDSMALTLLAGLVVAAALS
jgi:branched-subunit amino acid transport protein